MVAQRGAKEDEATLIERERIGREMLVYLRGLGTRSGRVVSNEMVLLKRVEVLRTEDGKISYNETLVAKG